MKMYFEYINNFTEALHIIEKWQSIDSCAGNKFLKSRAQDTRHSQLNLLAYLLLPVQRVPRYKLLLGDLVRRCPVSEREGLVMGYEKIERLAVEINDRKAEREGRKRLVELERLVVVSDERAMGVYMTTRFVDPARRLVKEEFVQVVMRRKKGAGGIVNEKSYDKKCLAVSCSDKLFLVMSSSSFDLRQCTSNPESSQLGLLAEVPLDNAVATRCWESPYEWRLVVFDGPGPAPPSGGIEHNISGGEVWRFKCDKEGDVSAWLEAISKATKRPSAIDMCI